MGVYCVYPDRSLVYHCCLIHHLKWETGFHSLSPQGRLPLSCSGSTGTHLEAIWGSDPSCCCLSIFTPPPSLSSLALEPPVFHPNASFFFSADGSFKRLMGICRAGSPGLTQGLRRPTLKSTVSICCSRDASSRRRGRRLAS